MRREESVAVMGAGVLLGLLMGWAVSARAQDLTSDLAFLLRGTVPQVAVDVDGATTFAISPRFPFAYISLTCEGAETINTITGGRQGTVLYLAHGDTDCTLADDDAATAADAIDLTGAATTDVGAAKKVVVLIYNGTDWEQVTESDN